jgi:hypothetical protein
VLPFGGLDDPDRQPLPDPAHLEVRHQAQLPLQKSGLKGRGKGSAKGQTGCQLFDIHTK